MKKHEKQRENPKRGKAAEIILGGIFVLLMAAVLSRKLNFHVDEIFSYGLANNNAWTFDVNINDGTRYEPAAEPFLSYVTAKSWDRFDYETVWYLQEKDVHPPLYYAVVHTVCSLSADHFSKWQAGAVNILFGVLTMLCLRGLLRLLLAEETEINMVTAVFICSAGTLSAISFLRMYTMAMFFVLLLTFLFVRQVKVWQEGMRAERKFDWKFYVKILLVTICGALTHYYCIVYAVLISIVFGIYLLCTRRWKDVLFFCGSMAAAGRLAVLIFPAMIDHIFYGQRGEQSFGNLANKADRITRWKVFYGFFNDQMFGGILTWLLIGIVLLGIGAVIVKKTDKAVAVRYLMIFIPCAGFFLLVSKTAVYQADRYLFPIYALGFGAVFGLAVLLMRQLGNRKIAWCVCGVLGLLMLWGSWRTVPWEYLCKGDEARLELVNENASRDCICIYDGARWKVQADLAEYMKYNSITFLRQDSYDPAQIGALIQTDGVVVSMVGRVDAESTMEQIRQYLPQYAVCEPIGNYGYSVSYVLRQEE